MESGKNRGHFEELAGAFALRAGDPDRAGRLLAMARERWPILSVRNCLNRSQVGSDTDLPALVEQRKRLAERLRLAGLPDN